MLDDGLISDEQLLPRPVILLLRLLLIVAIVVLQLLLVFLLLEGILGDLHHASAVLVCMVLLRLLGKKGTTAGRLLDDLYQFERLVLRLHGPPMLYRPL